MPQKNAAKPAGVSIVKEYDEWTFDLKQFDWINTEGKKLTDFLPLPKLLELLEERVDTGLE